MRLLLATLLLVFAAWAAPAPAAAQVQGSYRLVEVNGKKLPTATSAGESMTIESITLELRTDGRYEMRAKVNRKNVGTHESAEFSGTYEVNGGELYLHAAENGLAPGTFQWTLDNRRLRLVDEVDDEYVFARR